MAINTFIKDTENQNPLIWIVGLWSLVSLKDSGCQEYLNTQILNMVKDLDYKVLNIVIYAIGVVYQKDPQFIYDNNLLDFL